MMWRNSYRMPMRPGNAWWNEMRRLNRRMDYVFGGTRGPIGREYPLLNAWANDDGLLLGSAIGFFYAPQHKPYVFRLSYDFLYLMGVAGGRTGNIERVMVSFTWVLRSAEDWYDKIR